MSSRSIQTQPSQAVLTALFATTLRRVSDQNPVMSFVSTDVRYSGIRRYVGSQSPVIQCLVSRDWFRFKNLKESWKQERGISSSTTQSAMCMSYQRIIAMGEKAIPFILSDLRDNPEQPDQWFWALRVITEQNPVPDAHRGNFAAMARDWLKWAESADIAKFQPSLKA